MADGFVSLSRSLLISFSMDSRIASLQALWQISVKSAPENPLVILARKSRSTSWSQRMQDYKNMRAKTCNLTMLLNSCMVSATFSTRSFKTKHDE